MKRPLEHSTPGPNSAPESVATLHLIACHQAHLGEQLLLTCMGMAGGTQEAAQGQPYHDRDVGHKAHQRFPRGAWQC